MSALCCGGRDLEGDWMVSSRRYNRTEHRRLTLRIMRDGVTARFGDVALDGAVRDGSIELHCAGGDGPPVRIIGRVEPHGLLGTYTIADAEWTWKATRVPQRVPASPRTHAFEPTEFHREFSDAIPPALSVYPGDSVKTWTVDSSGFDARGVQRSHGGNPQTGPFYVEGALPGDTLAVRLTRLHLNRTTAVSRRRLARDAVTATFLEQRGSAPNPSNTWFLDPLRGVARPTDTAGMARFEVPLRPMLGCVGVAPPAGMKLTTEYPGTFGGNMDYNRIRQGVTVLLPVYQPGALLFVGDGHAAQGDGELTVSALETSMDVELTVDVIQGRCGEMPRAEDRHWLMAIGVGRSLGEALQTATTEMTRWLHADYGVSADETAAILGTSMRFDVAQIVNPNVTVAARLAKRTLARLEGARNRQPSPGQRS